MSTSVESTASTQEARSAFPVVTVSLLSVLLVAFLLEHVLNLGESSDLLAPDARTLAVLGGLVRASVLEDGEGWRLLTAPLLHADITQLVLLGTALAMVGLVLESLVGRVRTWNLFVAGALGGGALSLLLQEPDVVTVGVSGAVMAMLTGLFIVARDVPSEAERWLLRKAALRVLVPALLPVVFGSWGGTIDYAPHLGGTLSGALVGFLSVRGAASRGLAWAGVAGVVLALLACARQFPGYVYNVDPEHAYPGMLELACHTGSANGCNALGSLHIRGHLVPQDDAKATALFERACQGENVYGCSNLARALVHGTGTPKDEPRAARLFEKACAWGSAESCSNLGITHETGLGVPQDLTSAGAAYARACELGSMSGCNHLGRLHQKAESGIQDEDKAVAFYQKACDGNYWSSCTNLGLLLQNAPEPRRNEARAARLFEKACEGNDPDGCTFLGALHQEGQGVERDVTRALSLIEEGCKRGSARGCTLLGIAYLKGEDVARDAVKAVASYERGCDGGDGLGCANLGAFIAHDEGGSRDQSRPATLYTRACELGHSRGCALLADLLRLGLGGVARDEDRASALYTQACQQGFAPACQYAAPRQATTTVP